jgi:energy-coupling factor transporter ATP-binding protein EcfA2
MSIGTELDNMAVAEIEAPQIESMKDEVDVAYEIDFDSNSDEIDAGLEIEKVITKDLTKELVEMSKLHSAEKVYAFPSEQNLAKYALTKLVNKFGKFVSSAGNKASPPDIVTIETDINETTKVFQDVYSRMEMKVDGKNVEILVMAVYSSSSKAYIIMYASRSERALELVQAQFKRLIELNNFYQGKSLKFGSNGVEFVETPDLPLDKAVLPPEIIREFDLNVVKFLSEKKYHDITKKRALLLYGPPGTGKTTIIKSHFYILKQHNITSIFISDATFKNFEIEDVFSFIKKYLSPSMIAFEDIDLMGESRDTAKSHLIGSLLAVLNGVEDYSKPVVIVSTTNKFDILDDAVTRPCRFDRRILVDFPATENLIKMFENIMEFSPEKGIIEQKEGKDPNGKLTGAHIQEICNTARILSKEKDIDVKECVAEAVKTIKDNFYIGSPTHAGFSG